MNLEKVDEAVDNALDTNFFQPVYGELLDDLQLEGGDITPTQQTRIDDAEEELRMAVKDWLRFRIRMKHTD